MLTFAYMHLQWNANEQENKKFSSVAIQHMLALTFKTGPGKTSLPHIQPINLLYKSESITSCR